MAQDCTFYVQLAPDFAHYVNHDTGNRPVRRVKAVGVTQTRPARPRSGTVVVKLTVQIPDAAFHPLQPEAVITIPTALTEPHPIEVVATDPHEEAA